MKTAFLAVVKKSKIPPLRYRFAPLVCTRLAATGVDLLTAEELLGHSNISI